MLLPDEVQLGYALEAFSYGKCCHRFLHLLLFSCLRRLCTRTPLACRCFTHSFFTSLSTAAHSMGAGWTTAHHLYLTKAGINSMRDLATGCQDETVNLDLEFIGLPPEDCLSNETQKLLINFLPGPVGFRCFRLAQMAAEKVKKGAADAKYVHRPESGLVGDEKWDLNGDEWTLYVDCAGFVRRVLKHVTKDRFLVSLSDRAFMRAKDFYRFFETIPYSVTGKDEMPESDQHMKWRIVPDLRMVIPGDIIVYRPKGNAAGGAAFTTHDRSDLKHLLKAVKTAQLWHEEEGEWKNLVTRNVSRDPSIKPWVESMRKKLVAIGINTVHLLKAKIDIINDLLEEQGEAPLSQDTVRLMKECSETTALNTGHIVFAAGPAVLKGENEYRIRVVHSTKHGKKDGSGEVMQGVQEYFRRFRLVEGPNGPRWTRDMWKPPADDSNDNGDSADDEPDDIDPEDDDAETDVEMEEPGDDLAGQTDVEVLAARMCF